MNKKHKRDFIILSITALIVSVALIAIVLYFACQIDESPTQVILGACIFLSLFGLVQLNMSEVTAHSQTKNQIKILNENKDKKRSV